MFIFGLQISHIPPKRGLSDHPQMKNHKATSTLCHQILSQISIQGFNPLPAADIYDTYSDTLKIF